MATDVRDLDLLSLRERFAWWEAGGRLPVDAGEGPWLGVVQSLTMPLVRELRYREAPTEQLSVAEFERFLQVTDEVFSFLEERQLMSRHEVLTRRLILASALSGSGISLPDSPFTADRAVRQVIAVVTSARLAEASRLGPVWTTLEKAEILRLRHLKQLIRLAFDLREDLGDKEAAATVSSWLPAYSVLP
jgi:hypothetical protein